MARPTRTRQVSSKRKMKVRFPGNCESFRSPRSLVLIDSDVSTCSNIDFNNPAYPFTLFFVTVYPFENRQYHGPLFQKSAQVCLNTIDRLDLSSPKRQFNVKLRQSQAPQGRGCRKGRPACLCGHREKPKEALNKHRRTFLLASFRNRPPCHCLPAPRPRIFLMP